MPLSYLPRDKLKQETNGFVYVCVFVGTGKQCMLKDHEDIILS